MEVKKVLLEEFVKQHGNKPVDRESFRQANPLAFKAILAAFKTYAEFMQEVVKEKSVKPTVVTPKKVVAPVKKVTK